MVVLLTTRSQAVGRIADRAHTASRQTICSNY